MTNTTHFDPVWPISLRRWLIGTNKLACQFVNSACKISDQRAFVIRYTGETKPAEFERLQRFFNCTEVTLAAALAASKQHHCEMALLA